jgi:hypothetical protein
VAELEPVFNALRNNFSLTIISFGQHFFFCFGNLAVHIFFCRAKFLSSEVPGFARMDKIIKRNVMVRKAKPTALALLLACQDYGRRVDPDLLADIFHNNFVPRSK